MKNIKYFFQFILIIIFFFVFKILGIKLASNFSGKIFQGGNYFKPMDENTLREVINKIENKHYKFQKKSF